MEKLILNDDQNKSLKDMLHWWDSDKKSLCLIGAAGSGKTTMAKVFLDIINVRTTVTGPTHKSRFVFAEKTGRPSDTLQRMLGFQPNFQLEKFDIHKAQFQASGTVKINSPILPIDEASMINKDMNDYLSTLAQDYNFKIFYLGDKRQLPPIGEDGVSTVFSNVDVTTQLNTIVRQPNINSLTVLLLALRIDIANLEGELKEERDTYSYLKELINDGILKCSVEALNKNIGKLFKFFLANNLLNMEETGGVALIRENSEFIKAMAKEYIETTDDIKILSYYNDTSDGWNNYIRDKINKHEDFIAKGDLMTGHFNNGAIFNGCDYKILEVVKTELERIPVYQCKAINLLNNKEADFNVIRYTESDKLFQFQRTHEAYHKEARTAPMQAKKEKWQEYYNWLQSFQLPYSLNEEEFVHPDLDIYYKNLPKKTIGRGLSITIHKSQGSTYDTVFIDGNDLLNIRRQYGLLIFYKLLYVAASRPRNKCFIYFPKK